MTENRSSATFDGLGIAPKVLETLDRLKFKHPTPIQQKAIMPGLEGKDLIGIAQTGTGKTLAFSIPMVQRLSQSGKKGLVLVPTRELAYQVDATVQKLAPAFGMKTAVIIGGASMNEQVRALKKHPDILIATPGRLIDHLDQKNLDLSAVQILVLDEADRMLDMGFQPQIRRILKLVPKDRQTLLFSATMPSGVSRLASAYMNLPIHVEIAPSGTLAEKLTQELFIVKRENKKDILGKVLTKYNGSVLVFIRTKASAGRIVQDIRSMGHTAAELHSDRSLSQRTEALEGFKNGRYRVLVATDIAARGIDVVGIELVINYDLPEDPENYVHRIGRTGRANHPGHAISFATPDQKGEVVMIESVIRTALPISEHPDIPIEKFMTRSYSFGPRRFGSSSGGIRRQARGFRGRR